MDRISDKRKEIVLGIKSALSRFPNALDSRLEQGFVRLIAVIPEGFMDHRPLAHIRILLAMQFFLQKKIELILQKEGNQNRHQLKGFVFDHGECVDFRWAFFKPMLPPISDIHHFAAVYLLRFSPRQGCPLGSSFNSYLYYCKTPMPEIGGNMGFKEGRC